MSTPHPLSVWARNVSPSPTLAIDAKAKALMAAGEDVCSFAAGEPDFDTPEFIKDAAIAALKAGKTKYAPTPGIEPLRVAVAERYATEYGYKIASSQVVVSPGGKFSCYLGIMAVLKRQAKKKQLSIGELLRLAIEGLPAKAPKKSKG